MKKIIIIIALFFATVNINAKEKFYASFEINDIKYNCELIYERSDLIPTYSLIIRSRDLKTNVLKKTNLIIKKQEYKSDLRVNVDTWERFLKRKSSHRIPKEITFHIVDDNKLYASYVYERRKLSEFFFSDDLCLINNRNRSIYIYPNESVIFAVVRQFLNATTCLPNETIVTSL